METKRSSCRWRLSFDDCDNDFRLELFNSAERAYEVFQHYFSLTKTLDGLRANAAWGDSVTLNLKTMQFWNKVDDRDEEPVPSRRD